MFPRPKSLRSFIGASDFDLSRRFYRDLGFDELVISETMSLFRMGDVSFHLQRYYVADWVNNSMLFLEVEDIEDAYLAVKELDLPTKYPGAQVKPIQDEDWGREFFIHDPSGVLWHIGSFEQSRP
ncbi:MAG: VOC family protein [Pseudomonadota bacterium]